MVAAGGAHLPPDAVVRVSPRRGRHGLERRVKLSGGFGRDSREERDSVQCLFFFFENCVQCCVDSGFILFRGSR